jgi:hypothetical protein
VAGDDRTGSICPTSIRWLTLSGTPCSRLPG